MAQVATRLLAAVSGLLLVRILPVTEYGMYTIFLAAFTFVCTLSDLGVTETLSYFRRRTGGKKSWRHYLHAVLRFRRTLFLIGATCASAYIFYTGQHLGQDARSLGAAIFLVGVGAWYAIHSSILSYVLKLEQQFRKVYVVEVGNECVKLISVGLIWVTGFTTALGGLFGVSLGACFAAFLASRFYSPGLPKDKEKNIRNARRGRRLLLGQISPILPGTIYFTLQGPLVAWIAAEYGSIVTVAEVGALARINALIGVVAGFTVTIILPRLLAVRDERVFLARYFQWWGAMVILGGTIMLMVWIFPGPFLYFLGDAYSELHTEIAISAAAAVVATWGTFAWGINRLRGWIEYQPLRVPVIVSGQIPLFLLLDFSAAEGVLIFILVSVCLDVVFQTLINISGFIESAKMQRKTSSG
jgi:O-antigen/teichoic acid export membrane protein